MKFKSNNSAWKTASPNPLLPWDASNEGYSPYQQTVGREIMDISSILIQEEDSLKSRFATTFSGLYAPEPPIMSDHQADEKLRPVRKAPHLHSTSGPDTVVSFACRFIS